MDHNEAVREFEHLLMKEAGHAQEAAIELEGLVPLLANSESRRLAELQIKSKSQARKGIS